MTDVQNANRFVTVDGVSRRVKNYAMPLVEYFAKLGKKGLYKDGSEKGDPVPMAPPIGYVRQPTMVEHIRNMVRSEQLRMAAEAGGAESFEEADDFDVGDDEEPAGFMDEEDFEPPVKPAEPAKPVEPAAPGAGASPPAPGVLSGAPPTPPASS